MIFGYIFEHGSSAWWDFRYLSVQIIYLGHRASVEPFRPLWHGRTASRRVNCPIHRPII